MGDEPETMKRYDPTESITDIPDSAVFGPVASRRGGRSLGINILPSGKKACSFDCAYCMLGRTATYSGKGAEVSVDLVEEGLVEASEFLNKIGMKIESIALTGNGEPNLKPGIPRDRGEDTGSSRLRFFRCSCRNLHEFFPSLREERYAGVGNG